MNSSKALTQKWFCTLMVSRKFSIQPSVPPKRLEDELPEPPKIVVSQQAFNTKLKDYLNVVSSREPSKKSYLSKSDKWATSDEMKFLLSNLTSQFKFTNILELGAGASSIVFAKALSMSSGGCFTSIESMPQWCQEEWAEVTSFKGIDACLIEASVKLKVGLMGLYYQYKIESQLLKNRAPFDLVFIDGPQYYLGRDGVLPLIAPHLAEHALIVLDDAGRKGERWAISRWLDTYPALKVIHYSWDFGGRGLAVLSVTSKLKPRISLKAIFSCTQQTYLRWQRRRRGDC